MPETQQPKVLILTLTHGAAHQRAAKALRQALLDLRPGALVEVIDTLAHCRRWFKAYYDSYLIPLRYWPRLWSWIESVQHQSDSTGPGWLYRKGARPLFQFIAEYAPDVVVATEVGTCELAALHKRKSSAGFLLAGLELMDFNRAWIQPEVDLYLTTHPDLAEELRAAGAPAEKITTTGQPIDLTFASLPDRAAARARLGIREEARLLLVLFGGAGFGKPERILEELRKVRQPFDAVLIAGRNRKLEARLKEMCREVAHCLALGWVENIQEWMVASDLMIGKPGGATLMEGAACGLPLLAFDPLPGNEERTCRWIEKWGAGRWVKSPQELSRVVEGLLSSPQELAELQAKARALSRPNAARDAALAVLALYEARKA
jgi:processive 1,2-diacylglycerol beta-glucosyltransferase